MTKEKEVEKKGTGLNPVQKIVMHPYHCVICGTQLREIGMGILECDKCKRQFLPTISKDNSEYSISWSA